VIAIGPGEPGQPIHRDQWAFDFFPFPMGYEVQCNTIWAMSDFTAENGATRVIPGSHLYEDKLELTHDDCEAAEMPMGSVFVYTGAVYHGGGANKAKTTRYGLNLTYARSWLRQEENQYLSVPLDVARELPDALLKLIGYQRGAYALGYVDDVRDPLDLVQLRPPRGVDGPRANRGDGKGAHMALLPAGSSSFRLTHVYSSGGDLKPNISVKDDDGAIASQSLSLFVTPFLLPEAIPSMPILLASDDSGVAGNDAITSVTGSLHFSGAARPGSACSAGGSCSSASWRRPSSRACRSGSG
jgi:hypothetical protein